MTLLTDQTAVHGRSVGVVLVSGDDRLAYLQTLLSQDLGDAAPGTVADFLYLDPKGNAKAVGRAVVRQLDVVLVTPPAVAATFAGELNQFTFLMDATAEDLSEIWAMASVRGPQPAQVPGAPDEAMTAASDGDGLLVRDRSGGVDLLGPGRWVEERLAQLDLPAAADGDWEAWRILAAEPAWASEITGGRRAQELGLLPTHVHLRKGCYPGQESIAKTYNLGRPRRALCVVQFDGPVAPGATLDVGGQQGTITSAAAGVALALVPLDREGGLRGDGKVTVDGMPGRVLRRVGEGLQQPGA